MAKQVLPCPTARMKVASLRAIDFEAARSEADAKSKAEENAKKKAARVGAARAAEGYQCEGHFCELKHEVVITDVSTIVMRIAEDEDPTDTFLAISSVEFDLFVSCKEIRDALIQILKGFKELLKKQDAEKAESESKPKKPKKKSGN